MKVAVQAVLSITMEKYHYAKNGDATAVNAASGDAQYLADYSKIMNSQPAWTDVSQQPPLRMDFVPPEC